MDLLSVALVGRPNVGKSTLFNRLVGKHVAITAAEAGTTRDRIERTITLERVTFTLADVGGIEIRKGNDLEDDIQAQARHAVSSADLVLFLVDAKTELTPDDTAAAEILRRSGKRIFFIANKFESDNPADLMSFTTLGLGLPLGISAAHKLGLDELKSCLLRELRKLRRAKKVTTALSAQTFDAQIVFTGRPNVGKSSLVNALLGEPRVIVSEIPCTTRDVNDLVLNKGGKIFRLLDTAGMRRSGKIGTGLDRFATGRTLSAFEEAEVALLVLDGAEGVTAQDLHIAEKIFAAGCSLILVVNKVDQWFTFTEEQDKWLSILAHRFSFAQHLPVIMVSAKTGVNLEHILSRVLEVKMERMKRIPTGALNRFTQKVIAEHAPTRLRTKTAPKIFYVTQAESAPPTFIFFVARAANFHFSYKRYLENRLREEFGFAGTPIRIQFRERKRRARV